MDTGVEVCAASSECDDGEFCNGPEMCLPGAPEAGPDGCVPGTPPCSGGECDEATDRCVCAGPPDADGDGHDSLACGGADCDDGNALVNPGVEEVCDSAGVDEDCDPSTLAGSADGDRDGDGFVSAECCNGGACGDDCDDATRFVAPGIEEICNARDDNCDGEVDEAGAFCPVGMCMSNRCRAVPWERVFGAADDDPLFGVAVDSAGVIYLGVNNDTATDIDGDGTDELSAAYLVALEADGRFRFVTSVSTVSAIGLAILKDGTAVVVGTSTGFARFSTVDGAAMGEPVLLGVPGASVSDVQAIGATEAGVVAAVSFRTGASSMLELVLVDPFGTELARRRFDGSSGVYEFQSFDVNDPYMAMIANTDGSYEIAGTAVDQRHVVVLDTSLDPLWARSTVTALSVAVSATGGAALAGRFTGELAPPWTANSWTADGTDGYLAVFSPAGEPVYTRIHTGPGSTIHAGLAYDGRDSLFEAGSFIGELPMAPRGTLGPAVEGADAFYAHVDASSDFTLDALAVSGPRFESVLAVRVDAFGALLVVGSFNWSGVTLPSGTFYAGVNRNNLFVLRVASF